MLNASEHDSVRAIQVQLRISESDMDICCHVDNLSYERKPRNANIFYSPIYSSTTTTTWLFHCGMLSVQNAATIDADEKQKSGEMKRFGNPGCNKPRFVLDLSVHQSK